MRSAKTDFFSAVELAQSQSAASAFSLEYFEHFAAVVKWTDTTVSAFTFDPGDVTLAADTITETGHGLVDQQVVRFSTTGGLPTGLSAATDYYVIKVDADTFQVATSRANAIAGTQVDITGQGTGTHTCTPTGLAASVKLQYAVVNSPAEADWVDVSSGSIAVPGAGSPLGLDFSNKGFRALRGVFTPTSGSGSLTFSITAKGL